MKGAAKAPGVPGRPPLVDGGRGADTRVGVHVSKRQHGRWMRAARREKVSLAEWVRRTLDAAA